MASPTAEQGSFSDVRKVGYLRKPKSAHKRFFVLRAAGVLGPSRLEYYENEKKWRDKSGAPKRSILLENCFNINKRADSKNRYLVALYTKDEYFAIAAESEEEQEMWYGALLDLHNRGKCLEPSMGGVMCDDYGEPTPGPAFKEVWQVILKPKGLGQSKNLTGIYRLCLTHKNISFVKLNSDSAAVVLQLRNIRRCGHSENFFFIEVGRSAITGPGEFWMQAKDSVVAQNMHETILETMKAMSEEFRPRSKSQSSSSCSNPISVPLRRHHHHSNPPPSQVGLGRRWPCSSRVRASSDGEGTMPRPASVDGSLGSPVSARTRPHRHRGGSVLCPPLNHSRSIPMPPSATSPVSLSSSSTSGHGSASDGLFPRRSSASVSDSPSDGGFVSSSDEYGSSPGDRCATPDSLGHTPPAPDQELSSYVSMGTPGVLSNGMGGRSLACGMPTTPTFLEELELEKVSQKRTPFSDGSPLTAGQQRASVPAHTSSALPYPDEPLLEKGNGAWHKDDGYMPMSPGVVRLPAKSDDYVPMCPKSISAHHAPRCRSRADSSGYVMMSPVRSSSQIQAKLWMEREVEEKATPLSTSTPPLCYFSPVDHPPRPPPSYFSLPRSFRHGQQNLSVSSGRLAYADSASSSPSSTSSDGLGGQVRPERAESNSRPVRPTCLQLGDHRASTLPRTGEDPNPPEPKSPGEYVNMDFCPRPLSNSARGVTHHASEYVNVALAAPPSRKACCTAEPLACGDVHAANCAGLQLCDYVSMQVGVSCLSRAEPLAALHCTSTLKAPPCSVSPNQDGAALSSASGLVPTISVLSAFTRVNSMPSRDQGARVIRVDPQGRRRHSSETFPSAAAPPCREVVKRHSSASFESVWPEPSEVAGEAWRNTTSHNGLNYIDLDLAEDQNHKAWSSSQPKPSSPASGSGADGLNAYTSVHLEKPED